MAVPELALLFLGTLAVLASIGLFVDFGDETDLLVAFAAALLWAVFGLSAMDVSVSAFHPSDGIDQFVFLGLGLAFVCVLFGVWRLYESLNRGAEEARLGA